MSVNEKSVAVFGLAAVLLVATPGFAAPSTAELVADIRDEPGPASSTPAGIVELSPGVSLFVAHLATTGRELWRTDGTAAGTSLVKDIVPGPGSPNIDSLFVVGGLAYFSATTPDSGTELWRSDGSAAGTFLVKDLWPGSPSGGPTGFTSLDDTLLFGACTDAGQCGLWRSDGTPTGTFMVKGGWGFNSFGGGIQLLHKVLFTAAGPPGVGYELWESDGTESGTALLKDLYPGSDQWGSAASSSPSQFTTVGDTAFFNARDADGFELWKSDGTAAGTTRVKDLAPGMLPWGPVSGDPRYLTRLGTLVLFEAYDGQARRLWKSDGTEGGTRPVAEATGGLQYCGSGYGYNDTPLAVTGGALYLNATGDSAGCELWRTDGTDTGTALVVDLRTGPGGASPDWLRAAGGRVFFTADDGVNGRELWSSNGTAAGTVLLTDVTPADAGWGLYGPAGLSRHGTGILMAADDGNIGGELWASDGTPAGTSLVKDIWASTLSAVPRNLVTLDDDLYFFAYGASGEDVLYRSDGTASGTLPLAPFTYTGDLVAAGGMLLFTGCDQENCDLWRSDGTVSGTVRVKDFTGQYAGPTSDFVALGGWYYFPGYSESEGSGLWRTDGTTSGTSLFAAVGAPALLTVVGDTLFFVAADSTHGRELWKTDGTAAGTVLVKDIRPGMEWGEQPASSDPRQLFAFGDLLLFYAWDPYGTGLELWRSDGTEAGTQLVKDISEGPGDSIQSGDLDDLYGNGRPFFTEYQGKAYFFACDMEAGCEPWGTDGTTAGTQRLKDVLPGPAGSTYSYYSWYLWPPYSGPRLGVAGDRLFFGANGHDSGFELWVSDGTEAGTRPLRTVVPGTGYLPAGLDSLTDVDGVLHFLACEFHYYYAFRNCALWKSDGTEAGTEPALTERLVFDQKSYFTGRNRLLLAGSGVYFPAEDDAHGVELFRIVSVADPLQLLNALDRSVAGISPGASLSSKIAKARTLAEGGNLRAACGVVRAFSNEVEARRGKTVSTVLADNMVADAQAVMMALGCE